jgi:hypothetical protein
VGTVIPTYFLLPTNRRQKMFDQIESTIIGSEAIDAFTITASSAVGRAQILAVFEEITEIKREDVYWSNWTGLGYKGYLCDGVRYGTRRDGSALFATGREMSQRAVRSAVEGHGMGDIKTTRIDVCTDFSLRERNPHWLYEVNKGRKFQKLHQKANRLTTYISSTTGDTLYIGKRTSGRYGRIYDKSEYYGLERGWVYRVELESKRKVAPAVIKRLFPPGEDSETSWGNLRGRVKRMLGAQFAVWGIQLPLEHERDDLVRAEVRVTTEEAMLEWMSRTVRPAFLKLSNAGYRQMALSAIGVVDEVDIKAFENPDPLSPVPAEILEKLGQGGGDGLNR